MKAILISTFLSIVIFFLLIEKDKKKAILIIVFMLPIAGNPLTNKVINTGLRLDIVSILILVYWFVITFVYKKSQQSRINLNQLSPKIKYLYYFIVWGIFLGVIYLQDGNDHLMRTAMESPLLQVINNSILIILVIIFFKILMPFQYDYYFRSKMAKVFIITIFINLFSSLLYFFKFEGFLWGLFRTQGVFGGTDVRISGLYASFGFGVYVTLIVAFSLLYYRKHKLLSITAIIATVIFSLLSGTRQTIVFIALFIAIVTIIFSLTNRLKLRYMLLIVILVIGFVLSFDSVFSTLHVFERLDPGIETAEQGNILLASGRDIMGIPAVLAELSTYPITGKGLLNLYSTKNSLTNIAGHVIWFNIYKKFGIIGFIYLIIIFVYPIIKLFRVCMITKDKNIFMESSILFALMVIVFAQQFWDNFFWFSNTMLLYGFIYFWYFSFINNNKIIV